MAARDHAGSSPQYAGVPRDPPDRRYDRPRICEASASAWASLVWASVSMNSAKASWLVLVSGQDSVRDGWGRCAVHPVSEVCVFSRRSDHSISRCQVGGSLAGEAEWSHSV